MAIFHMSVKAVQRSVGRSAVASAAYRSASRLVDERTGEIHDYQRKEGVEATGIVLPPGSTWNPSRSELWNAAELAERRKDACVAREHEVALPHELDERQRHELAHAYARDLAQRHGCAVDYAIHAPADDGLNWHVHVMQTTREVSGEGLGGKCEREKAGRNRKADLDYERERWGRICNRALERAGRPERVDHRSLEAQGIDREPTQHRGPAVTAIAGRGEHSDVLERQEEERRQRDQERAAELEAWRELEDINRQVQEVTGEVETLHQVKDGMAEARREMDAWRADEQAKEQARAEYEAWKQAEAQAAQEREQEQEQLSQTRNGRQRGGPTHSM